MFLGTDGGILGVGTPEVFTILLVGYFVLGPSDLYKLVKEIGKFVQNIRTLGSEASQTFESTMETQLELDDLRKAQRDLNDAFSFRRSINVDQDGAEAFAEPERGEEPIRANVVVGGAATATEPEENADGTPAKPKKRIRRRKKKAPVVVEEVNGGDDIPGDIPDLDMNSVFDGFDETAAAQKEEMLRNDAERVEDAERAKAKADRLERLEASQPASEDLSSVVSPDAESDRFASQLTADDWNAQIMANEDLLSPLAKVMERLAILEDEKVAADARLEEEFLLRTELEEKYYREKRNILEEAAAEVQANAYNLNTTPEEAGSESSSSTVV